ncbi:MAG: cyclic nucleotide-binding domain-containing protein [Verrucomicrobia bacterium]|nr:cyclic nucleotide-binding domain-containing protein [Verrucomicrobiota bacterium]
MGELKDNKVFAGLLTAELRTLEQTSLLKKFAAGQPIFTEGDPGAALYLVNDGRVQISALLGDNERRVLATIEPGDFFGEMAVLDDKPRSASATAEVASTVWEVSRDELLRVLARSPEVAVSMLRAFSQRLREFDRQFVDELLQAERLGLVGRFTRSILHDVKGPLAIIAMAAELATMQNASPDQRRTAAERIGKQVDRISNMINELIEFTRGSHAVTVLAAMDYRAFVAPLIEDLRSELSIRSIELVLENPPPAVNVKFDPRRLANVFLNLVHNAADAMNRGGKVTFRFAVDANELRTEIQDTGPGIAPEIAGRLFQPFVTHGKSRGTGLGLSICKRIMRDHGGSITVRSEPGKGACFTFTLPIG